MTGFDLRRRTGLDDELCFVGRRSIQGQLFDLGPYPAAVPSAEGQVWGEVYETRAPAVLLATLTKLKGTAKVILIGACTFVVKRP